LLAWNLSAEVGETWLYGTYLRFVATLESRTDTVITEYDTLYPCIRISFHGINVIDADHALWFAPEIGIVKNRSLDWGLESYLIKAYVNGRKIPSPSPLPEIFETIPDSAQQDIPIDAFIKLSLSWNLRPSFITPEYFQIQSAKGGIVSGTFDGYRHIVFTPATPFDYGDTILVTVSQEVEDYMGDRLSEDFQLSFVTEALSTETLPFLQDTSSVFMQLDPGDFDLGDYDNDGDDDIIIFGTSGFLDGGSTRRIELYEQQDGIFYNVPTDFLPLNPEWITRGCIKWADYTNDGLLDLVYAGLDTSHNGATLFYRNLGGGFELDPSVRLDFAKASMDWADYDLDGDVDLAIWGYTRQASTYHAAIYRNDNGTLVKQQNDELPFESLGIIKWIDFNSDGYPDILTVGRQINKIFLYRNTGGQFVKSSPEIADDDWLSYHFNIDFSDIDKDGDIDFLVDHYILLQQQDSLIIDPSQIDVRTAFSGFQDYDNDGYDDLFVIGQKDDAIGRIRTYLQIYHNDTDGQPTIVSEFKLSGDIYVRSGIWKDLDSDGKIDLIMNTNQGFMIYYNIMESQGITGGVNLPDRINLHQNYPNPFNITTTLLLDLPVASYTTLTIYDILGREVTTLVDSYSGSGYHRVEWNGRDLAGKDIPSGIYIARLVTPEYSKAIKMVLLK
jgi:hypothetical protein